MPTEKRGMRFKNSGTAFSMALVTTMPKRGL